MIPRDSQRFEQFPQWDVASLIDLECLHETRETDADTNKRDRELYQEECKVRQLDPGTLNNPGAVLRIWVEARRRANGFPQPGPGESVAATLAAFRFWGGIVAIVIGVVFVWGALNISYRQVNVIVFWILTIGLPLSFTSIGFYLLLANRFLGKPRASGVFSEWIKRRVLNMASNGMRLVNRHAPQENLVQMDHLAGVIKRRTCGRSPIMAAEISSLVHQIGLGLIGGIVIAIASFRMFSYQDYGWQTHTAWLTPERTHSIVRAVAMPWKGFTGDGIGYPSLDQIRNTRLFRHSESAVPNPGASVAWSSFLFWSSLVYGLLPRALLMFVGRVALRRTYEAMDFSKFDSLLRCLNRRDVVINFPDEDSERSTHDTERETTGSPTQKPDSGRRLSPMKGPAILLAPEEFNNPKILERILGAIREQDLEFDEAQLLPSLPSARRTWLQSLEAQGPSRVLILQNSLKPPNQSFERFLKEIRGKLGAHLPVHVVLIHQVSHPNASNHLVAWQSRFNSIGDPLISLSIVDSAQCVGTALDHPLLLIESAIPKQEPRGVHDSGGTTASMPHLLPANDLTQPSPQSCPSGIDRLEPAISPAILLTPREYSAPQVIDGIRGAIRDQDLEFDAAQLLPSLPSERSQWLESYVKSTAPRPSRVLILQESVRPPNQSFERFLENIRGKLGGHLPIHVILLHQEQHPNSRNNLVAWRSRLDSMGDPLISLNVVNNIENNLDLTL